MGLTWTLVFIAALVVFFVVLSAILNRTGGHAPGWQVRCISCGHVRPAAEAGIVRVGAFSLNQFTLARCPACGKVRFTAVERAA